MAEKHGMKVRPMAREMTLWWNGWQTWDEGMPHGPGDSFMYPKYA